MICPICGAEVQIVPDYNPLDDVLAQEVKGICRGCDTSYTDGWGQKIQKNCHDAECEFHTHTPPGGDGQDP